MVTTESDFGKAAMRPTTSEMLVARETTRWAVLDMESSSWGGRGVASPEFLSCTCICSTGAFAQGKGKGYRPQPQPLDTMVLSKQIQNYCKVRGHFGSFNGAFWSNWIIAFPLFSAHSEVERFVLFERTECQAINNYAGDAFSKVALCGRKTAQGWAAKSTIW